MTSRSTVLSLLLVATAAPSHAAPPQWQPSWGVEVRSGPYQPRIGDRDERAYYRLVYASKKNDALFEHRPLLTTLEIDWYVLRSFGLFGPLVRAGIWSASGPTRECGPANRPASCTPEDVASGASRPSTDETTLRIVPVGVGVVYRMDLLKRATGVPLVPFVKGGLDYYFWRNTVGGRVSQRPGTRGAGGTLGAQASAGVALNIDWIEPDASARAHASTGLTDTYVFGEATRMWADGFGDEKRLDFSGYVVQIGLTLDFN